jgi:hypothetical protein
MVRKYHKTIPGNTVVNKDGNRGMTAAAASGIAGKMGDT